MKRPAQLSRLLERGIERCRVRERVRIERNIGIQRRPFLIIGCYPIQVALHEFDACQGFCPIGVVDLIDRRLFKRKTLVERKTLGHRLLLDGSDPARDEGRYRRKNAPQPQVFFI
jgi:hypothetical protein